MAVLGRGPGLGSVLRALRGLEAELMVVVGAAQRLAPEASGPDPDAETRWPSPAAGELRESLQALTGDEVALSRAMRRPLAIDRLGRHPLGSLLIQSLSSAFGDLGAASVWLGDQLGISGAVLPATPEPLSFSCRGGEPAFVPERPVLSAGVAGAIRGADLVLLAPGALCESVLVSTAIPGIADALQASRGRVIWIAGLTPEGDETAAEQLAALRRHRVRVEAVLYDPRARLRADAKQLRAEGVEPMPRRLTGDPPVAHVPLLLRAALIDLLGHHQHV